MGTLKISRGDAVALMDVARGPNGFMNLGLLEVDGRVVCGCYPECRYDCPSSMECYDRMPEYWSKKYKAKKYAEGVRNKNPDVAAWVTNITGLKEIPVIPY